MKTWNVYTMYGRRLVDVVTSSDAKESWDVKDGWWDRSETAEAERDRNPKCEKYEFVFEEPDHYE